MGMFPAPPKCFFTGLSTINMSSETDSIDYFIRFNGKNVGFCLRSQTNWENLKVIKDNLTALKGDIYNLNWPPLNKYIREEDIEKQILSSDMPKTPKEKLDNLFIEIFKLQKSEGEEFKINDYLFDNYFCGKLYFKNTEECNFYLKTLHNHGLINAKTNSSGFVISLSITFEGLNYQIELTEIGSKSNNCFIAMSFGETITEIREAIKIAIRKTGYNPLLIDEIHIDSDKTINDEIIANIKKSKFCISDFTEQKDGVYFEAGYALGRGLKVIYTCQEDWFKQTHFDTNHFPHIIYKDSSELTQKLISKIEAWIK